MLDYRIATLAIDPTQTGTIYAGGDEGEFFKSTDGGLTWSNLTGNLTLEPSGGQGIPQTFLNPLRPRNGLPPQQVGWNTAQPERRRVLDHPGQTWLSDYPNFTAMVVVFDAKPILILGISGEGAWRFAASE